MSAAAATKFLKTTKPTSEKSIDELQKSIAFFERSQDGKDTLAKLASSHEFERELAAYYVLCVQEVLRPTNSYTDSLVALIVAKTVIDILVNKLKKNSDQNFYQLPKVLADKREISSKPCEAVDFMLRAVARKLIHKSIRQEQNFSTGKVGLHARNDSVRKYSILRRFRTIWGGHFNKSHVKLNRRKHIIEKKGLEVLKVIPEDRILEAAHKIHQSTINGLKARKAFKSSAGLGLLVKVDTDVRAKLPFIARANSTCIFCR